MTVRNVGNDTTGDIIMKTRSSRMGIALIICIFFLSSCGATKLSNTWTNSAFEGRYLKNVLVVAISDQLEKKKLEGTFAKHFQERGVNAVSLASTTQKKELTSDDVKAEAAAKDMDSIFTIKLISISEKEVIGRFAPPPESSPDWSYSFPLYSIQTPPVEYKIEEKDIVMEFNLYDAATGKLMWKVRSETIKPGSSANLIDEASRMVVKNLSAGKFIR
jgi:hypothetical protein